MRRGEDKAVLKSHFTVTLLMLTSLSVQRLLIYLNLSLFNIYLHVEFYFQENGLTLTLRLVVYPQLSQLPQLSPQQLHLLYLQLRHDQLEGCLRTSLDQQVGNSSSQTKPRPKTTCNVYLLADLWLNLVSLGLYKKTLS